MLPSVPVTKSTYNFSTYSHFIRCLLLCLPPSSTPTSTHAPIRGAADTGGTASAVGAISSYRQRQSASRPCRCVAAHVGPATSSRLRVQRSLACQSTIVSACHCPSPPISAPPSEPPHASHASSSMLPWQRSLWDQPSVQTSCPPVTGGCSPGLLLLFLTATLPASRAG